MQSPTNVVGKRVAAFLIDGLIDFVIIAIFWFALTTQIDGKCPSGGGGVTIGDNCRGFVVGESGKQTTWYLICVVAALLIFVVLPGIRGITPGKAIMGIKLVNAEGNPPGVGRALLRYILWIVDAFPYIIPNLTGFIVALNSGQHQRVGDMAASTFVVAKETAGAPTAAQPAFAGAQYGSPGAGQYGAPLGGPPAYSPPAYAPPQPQPQPQQQPQVAQKADWYPDPHGQARLRYWDGQRWTEHTSA